MLYDSRVEWTVQVPRLVGDLAVVREVVLSDVSTLFELLSDPAVTEHLSSPPPSESAFAGFIGWAHRQRAAGNGVCFGIVPHGLEQAVGIIQVRALEPSFFVAEWGFAVGVAFWSTGVFIAAANLVAQFAFETLKVNRLEARAVSQNARGQAALQKLGARPEAALSRAFRKGARRDQQLLWTLREEDWRQRPLLGRRLDAAQATEQVAQAVQQTRRLMEAETPRQVPSAARDYPFFVTGANDEPERRR